MTASSTSSSAASGATFPIRLAWIALIVLASVVFMGKAYQQSLQAMDSSVHARLALDITSNGLAPVLPIRAAHLGHDQAGFNDHPMTLFYLVGWIMRALGPSAWSARLLPSLFAVGCVPLTVWLATLLFDAGVGLSVGFVLTFSIPFISYGARFQLDHAMIFFILLSFIGWQKRIFWLTGLAAGLGMWMKNPVAFLVLPAALLSLAMTGSLNRTQLLTLIKASLVAVLVGAGIWLLEGLVGGWDIALDYWHRQVFGTAVGGRGYTQSFDPFLFTEALRRRYWPWLPFLLLSIVLIIRKRAWKNEDVALPLAATLVVLVAISSMRFKFDHYYFPMYPFLAILTVFCVRPWIARNQKGITHFIVGAGLVLPAFLLAMPIELSPEMFPALRKFEAIIQSHGTCADKILWIEGGQPYGSFSDYDAELGFYTNRPTIQATCAQAASLVKSQSPEWILVSTENRSSCLSPELLASYGSAFKFGNQLLLGRLPKTNDVDLTPLARELQAPKDCEATPIPGSRYFRAE